jgi:phospholipid/cholesterol/gamma-HCH transport system substrate-binding protein
MRRLVLVATSLLCAVAVSSCAAINVNDLPQPGNSYSDGYDIVVEFANVLNLPDHARVVMDGNLVGVVERVSAGQSAVEVTVRIDRTVKVPSDTRAVLQQATVLGEIYVALDRAPDAAGGGVPLRPGGRVPLAHTTSPPQLEDTLANAAYFISSGSIQRIQDSIIRINQITPKRVEELRAIASRVSMNLSDLSENINTVDQWLSGLAGTVNAMADSIPKFQYWFSPAGMRSWDHNTKVTEPVGTLFPSVGSVYDGGYWLVPFINSLGIALGAVQKSKWAIEGEYRPWRKLFTDLFLPEDKYPAMNITSVQTADGREISGNVQDVLRMLGATP